MWEIGAPKKPPTNWRRVGLVVGGLIVLSAVSHLVVPNTGRVGATTTTAQAITGDAGCGVRKANGAPEDRPCDLRELCANAKFFDAQESRAAAAGDVDAQRKAAVELDRALAWMQEYRHEDVVTVCGGGAGRPPQKPPGECLSSPFEEFAVGASFSEETLRSKFASSCAVPNWQRDSDVPVTFQGKRYRVRVTEDPLAGDAHRFSISAVRLADK